LPRNEIRVDKAIKKLFEGYGNLLERVKAIESDIVKLKDEIDNLTYRVGEINLRLNDVRSIYEMGKYKYENCANRMEDGRCRAWVQKPSNENIKPTTFWCAVCHVYSPKG